MLSSFRLGPRPGLNSRLASFGHVSHCTKRQSRSQSTSTDKRYHFGVEAAEGKIDIDSFRRIAWDPKIPLLLRASHKFPANEKWFRFSEKGSYPSFSPYFLSFADEILPYEFTIPRSPLHNRPNSEHEILSAFLEWLLRPHEDREPPLIAAMESIVKSIINETRSPNNPSNFQQFEAPVALMIAACQFNENRESDKRLKNLYVAQSDLSHLPGPLFGDLPAPDIVKHAGKGDIYSSSIWLGLQPTYTPLHRDPNPNLFCQLVGSKKIRLMTPDRGDRIYAHVRKELGLNGNSRFRGTEMMEGRERQLLHDAVWNDATISEVLVNPTDALFIPMGWWHSVASNGAEGNLNASVNWWFR
ncbi:Clavaminate synthase-like protein [Annulohypoxylon maeteangense]|uniref:Clavaminate synthase-like protein n=1 Tax=Annulohypoxylon maeteangense TaxID=1927788 RepID=UPI002008AE9A|nr:Clavaminate synthase-like protein [Annulohypoxylon maeteangense]KAI0888318.1 Clavaminate synthase-like protein [Annulohypoxylon maeteangense]